ncbi:MAG: hypothetical protein K1X67_13580 [Fimbriimonadaceae bacterium]|nr:hypothetical protein [Fimbriimonadaceae bacterium]
MTVKFQLALLALGSFGLVVTCGCGGGTAPLTQRKMLVFGIADSPVLSELRKTYREDRYTGSQDPARYALVVVDGDSTTPKELGSLPLVSEALGKRVAVMLVDVGENHKAALTGAKLTQAHTGGDSAAYLITPLGGGRVTHLTNLRRLSLKQKRVRQVLGKDGVLQGSHQDSSSDVSIDGPHLAAYMQEIASRLTVQRTTITPPAPPNDYPSSHWFQTSITDMWAKVPPLMHDQAVSHVITYNFYVYLDSGSTLPSRYFQWCAMSMNGYVGLSAPAVNTNSERGFAHTLFAADIAPVNTSGGNGLQLDLYDAQPTQVTNNLTSTMEFNIGYKGGPNSAWLWQQTLTQPTPGFNGWEATSPPPPSQEINAVRLQATQTNPCNGDASNWLFGIDGNTVKPMNPVSTVNFEPVGQVVWRTQEVFDGIVQVGCSSRSSLMDLAVPDSYSLITLFPDGVTINIDFSQASAD